jgi:hypothetical protein
MEIIYERVRAYNKRTGKRLRVPDALIQILDEYDIMIDAERQSNGSNARNMPEHPSQRFSA